MSAKTIHLENMLPELNEMRETVAAAARQAPDMPSYRAYLMQAKSLRTMFGQITSTWRNAAQEIRAEMGTVDETSIELRYAERLGHWLRAHARHTADSMEGGETDLLHQRANLSEGERAMVRLYASRHYAMVAEYCESHAAALDSRAAEIRGESGPRL